MFPGKVAGTGGGDGVQREQTRSRGVTTGNDRPLSTELISAQPQPAPPRGELTAPPPAASASRSSACLTSSAGNRPPFSAAHKSLLGSALPREGPGATCCRPIRTGQSQRGARRPESGPALQHEDLLGRQGWEALTQETLLIARSSRSAADGWGAVLARGPGGGEVRRGLGATWTRVSGGRRPLRG